MKDFLEDLWFEISDSVKHATAMTAIVTVFGILSFGVGWLIYTEKYLLASLIFLAFIWIVLFSIDQFS